jgi:hypothetical protein
MIERRAPIIVVSLIAAGVGCTVDLGTVEGKSCGSVADCPFGYTCAAIHADGVPTCEVIYPNLVTLPGCVPNGPPAYYCTDGKPVLDKYCTVCHVHPPPNLTGFAIPDYFRLDQYADDFDSGFADGGHVLGALTMAQRILIRTSCQRDMPPAGYVAPGQTERQTIINWAAQQALLCSGDAGGGGTPDAGKRDGGDGG